MASQKPLPSSENNETAVTAEKPALPANQNRLLTMLALDLTAVLRGYFPKETARQLGRDCAAVARGYVEGGEVIRRISLPPSHYVPRQKAKR